MHHTTCGQGRLKVQKMPRCSPHVGCHAQLQCLQQLSFTSSHLHEGVEDSFEVGWRQQVVADT
jgi:hypothetical protein